MEFRRVWLVRKLYCELWHYYVDVYILYPHRLHARVESSRNGLKHSLKRHPSSHTLVSLDYHRYHALFQRFQRFSAFRIVIIYHVSTWRIDGDLPEY